MKSLSVYIHIPFCVRKCNYCDFLSAPATKETMQEYVQALKKEIKSEANKYKQYEIKTVFFGGGTPSILEGAQIKEIMDILRQEYTLAEHAEVTIEMNPATAKRDKMEIWRQAGVNRLSIGLQSVHDEELKMLGRVHCYQDFLDSYQIARSTGFANINIDLMSGLPGQSIEKWEDTLTQVLALQPEHISAYSLIIEEGTNLCQNIDQYPAIPSEEDDRFMYQMTKKMLHEAGYERYEISNYAKKGYESKHNSAYWIRENYVGFGLGASSMVENVRWTNEEKYEGYLANVDKPDSLKKEIQVLSTRECMEEFMFLGLRMMRGIKKETFLKNFKLPIHEVYGDVIEKWKKQNLLEEDTEDIRLTDQGIDVSNVIFSDFLA